MLNLVTDQRPGEPDLLAAVKHLAFEIRSLAGNVLATVTAPVSGWTHEQLLAVAALLEVITRYGADGYLGTQWVGSTEI
ncbi:hypothetical protein V2K54_25890 [Pseudomonas alliivorans]|nr:hypothetical protein [Pseudomonas alliivorans]